MPGAAAIIIPTRGRAGYLDDALASIAPHARAAGAEMIVVDDGPDEATRETAGRHGARYIDEGAGQGLNAARNRGAAATDASLLVFTDDDVIVDDAWLNALVAADADEQPPVIGSASLFLGWRRWLSFLVLPLLKPRVTGRWVEC